MLINIIKLLILVEMFYNKHLQKSIFEFLLNQLKSDYIYHFPIDFEPNKISIFQAWAPFGRRTFGRLDYRVPVFF